MSNKIMIDQIAFDEASDKVKDHLIMVAKLQGWSMSDTVGCVNAAQSVTDHLRRILFNTAKSSITNKEDKT